MWLRAPFCSHPKIVPEQPQVLEIVVPQRNSHDVVMQPTQQYSPFWAAWYPCNGKIGYMGYGMVNSNQFYLTIPMMVHVPMVKHMEVS